LRSRATRAGPLLKRDSFVRYVHECAKKNDFPPVWLDHDRLRLLAERLDPLDNGVISWRRFVHGLICGLLPSLPNLNDLVRTS
jgi:hypothetical protein